MTGLQVVVLPNGTWLDCGLANAFVLIPFSVLRTLLALLCRCVPVWSSFVALLAVKGLRVPERCLWRTHADLSS